MAWIITTRSHNGRTWYARKGGSTVLDRGRAFRYATEKAAQDALARQRVRSELDSAWHHGRVVEDAPADAPIALQT